MRHPDPWYQRVVVKLAGMASGRCLGEERAVALTAKQPRPSLVKEGPWPLSLPPRFTWLYLSLKFCFSSSHERPDREAARASGVGEVSRLCYSLVHFPGKLCRPLCLFPPP